MLSRIILSVVVAVVVTLVCVLVGSLLITVAVPVAVTVGGFLHTWAGAIGVLAGLWWFFSGATLPTRTA
jgi:hypothetical protein